jgi:arsenate reductase (thioredoxin)
MAAAWFNQLADSSKAGGISAGTNPGPHVHPKVIAAMREAESIWPAHFPPN